MIQLGRIPPTIGFNIGRIQIDKVIAVFWDLGGHASFRSVWHNYYPEVQGGKIQTEALLMFLPFQPLQVADLVEKHFDGKLPGYSRHFSPAKKGNPSPLG